MKETNQEMIDLKSFLPYQLSVLEQQISHSIARKYSEKFELSRMQWRVLSTLAMFQGITAKEICSFTHIEKMQASRAINGLESMGLLEQETDPADKRAYVLSLTNKGQNIYQQIVPKVRAEERRIFSSFDSDELNTFQHLVDKLCRSLET